MVMIREIRADKREGGVPWKKSDDVYAFIRVGYRNYKKEANGV